MITQRYVCAALEQEQQKSKQAVLKKSDGQEIPGPS